MLRKMYVKMRLTFLLFLALKLGWIQKLLIDRVTNHCDNTSCSSIDSILPQEDRSGFKRSSTMQIVSQWFVITHYFLN